jgi:UDP-N-acetylglucosamine diphosphorylase/glucosamine-1-phosphate N-acetyltransferase
MSHLVLLDDASALGFEPFALTRPVGELRAGTHLIRERWEVALGIRATGWVGAPHLEAFEELDAPPTLPRSAMVPAGTIIANSRCAPALTSVPAADVWTCDGRVAAVRAPAPLSAADLTSRSLDSLVDTRATRATIAGWWLDGVWDLVRHLGPMVQDDIERQLGHLDRGPVPSDVRGDHRVVVEVGARIEPWVVFDATAGSILVRRGATVASFTRLVGPCAIGVDSQVGGKISGSSIGEVCRVHGEVTACVLVGHANKAHDGFLGHSVLGRWANLGASTVTSNLKNTYGTVQLWTPGGTVDTGLQFLGSMIGDHVKTAIGTRLTTGCVIGAGANVVVDGLTPKVIPPFAWGGARGAVYDLAKFLTMAERAMQRRGVPLSERQRAALRAAYDARWRAGA